MIRTLYRKTISVVVLCTGIIMPQSYPKTETMSTFCDENMDLVLFVQTRFISFGHKKIMLGPSCVHCSSRSVVTEYYKGREKCNKGLIFFFPSLSTRLSPPPFPTTLTLDSFPNLSNRQKCSSQLQAVLLSCPWWLFLKPALLISKW
jgi:hypothetical protein